MTVGPQSHRVVVAVVGPRECDNERYAVAREVGRLLGEAGVIVATGGGAGVMAAAAQGASEAGATTVGFLPGADLAGANPFLTVPITTGLGEARNMLLVTASRAVVSVGSSWGTESELAFAVRLGKPVVAIDGWSRRDADGRPVVGMTSVDDPAAAVAAILGQLRTNDTGRE